MKKSLLLIIVTCCAVGYGSAQKLRYDFQVGMIYARQSVAQNGVHTGGSPAGPKGFLLTNTTVSPKVKSGNWAFTPGLALAGRVNYQPLNFLGINLGVGYRQKGFRSDYRLVSSRTDDEGNIISSEEFVLDDINRFNYLSLDLGIRIMPKEHLYFFGGYRFEKLVHINLEEQIEWQEAYFDDNDRSLFFGAGYEFSVLEPFHNYVELEVNPGLTDIYRDVNESSWDFSQIKNFSIGLSLGIRLK